VEQKKKEKQIVKKHLSCLVIVTSKEEKTYKAIAKCRGKNSCGQGKTGNEIENNLHFCQAP